MVLLLAEVAELKADPTIRARGSVIEAELDRGRGSVRNATRSTGRFALEIQLLLETHLVVFER